MLLANPRFSAVQYAKTGISVFGVEMPYCFFVVVHVSVLCMLHVMSVPSEWIKSLEVKLIYEIICM